MEEFNFESNSSDLKISITKYYLEDIPGHSISNFHVKFDNKLKIFDDFDKLIQFLKNIIPKIDLETNKFNL